MNYTHHRNPKWRPWSRRPDGDWSETVNIENSGKMNSRKTMCSRCIWLWVSIAQYLQKNHTVNTRVTKNIIEIKVIKLNYSGNHTHQICACDSNKLIHGGMAEQTAVDLLACDAAPCVTTAEIYSLCVYKSVKESGAKAETSGPNDCYSNTLAHLHEFNLVQVLLKRRHGTKQENRLVRTLRSLLSFKFWGLKRLSCHMAAEYPGATVWYIHIILWVFRASELNIVYFIQYTA